MVERRTKTLWLLFTRSLGDDFEKQIVLGTSKERTRVFVMSSSDSGVTWSRPLDMSAKTRKPEWTWYGIGSGIGVQLKSGRLVVPAYHNVEKTTDFSSHMIISDDEGKTWKLGWGMKDFSPSGLQLARRVSESSSRAGEEAW